MSLETFLFNIGFSELLVIGAIAVIFIDPRKLPEVTRYVARLVREFKKATAELRVDHWVKPDNYPKTIFKPPEFPKEEPKSKLIKTVVHTGDAPTKAIDPESSTEKKSAIQEGAPNNAATPLAPDEKKTDS